MNDLKLLFSNEIKLNLDTCPELVTFDSNMNRVYVSDHNKIYEIDSNDPKILQTFDLNEEQYSNSNDNKLISLQFLTESNNISLVNSKGDLSLLNVLTKEFEGVGTIPDGLSASHWSPDQELLVLLTNSNAMILMTKEFDILAEQLISVENVVEAAFVNVGWGSFETQFKGSEGKKVVKEKGEEKLLDWDDRRGRICWRSDGEFYVISFSDSNSNSRKFQVFNREGAVHSTIEKNITVLDAPICWKYSKSLIASSIYRLNKHEIIFFERNGLAHGGFTLPFVLNTMKVNGLYWNLDSSILCVWSEKIVKESTTFESVVQLWTVSNYHWYLKQSYNFDMNNKVTSVQWDPEDVFGLHVFTCNGHYLKYKLGQTVNYCNNVGDYNASIAVIDNNNVLITPFKNKIIPPPMSLHKLNLQLPVNNLIWSYFNMDLLVFLMNGELVYFKFNQKNGVDLKSDSYEMIGQTRIELDLKMHNASIQHILWTKEDELMVIADTINSGFNLAVFKIIKSEGGLKLAKQNQVKLEFPVLNVTYNRSINSLAIQSNNGQVHRYDENWIIVDEFQFTQPCPTFKMIKVLDNKVAYVGLTQFYRLYANKIEISNNCNSFYVHDEYLLFTDHTNTLKFVDLKKINDSNAKTLKEETMHRVERGAKLVIAIHSDTNCILQMPRGNLESIHPRTLLISKLKHQIDNFKYLESVQMMRKHRVNMNILYDHNPEKFLKNLALFVNQVENPNLINLFLTELNNDDTTLTFYKDYYDQSKTITKDLNSNNVIPTNKLRDVCSNLIDICEKQDDKKYFLVTLSCYAKMKELEKALVKISQFKDENNTTAVDEGLRHLLYIVDVNELFDVSLGTYNFDLVLMVAEKSQKDPKEYLPFLNDLKKLEENHMKYKIDLYLKRYKKALQSIVKCGESRHEEVIKLTDDHKLYTEALKYFNVNDDLFKKISKLFAAHLSGKKYYEEAGFVLFRANLFEDSLDSFLKASNWQMYINALLKLKKSGTEFVEQINLLIDRLLAENKYFDCSTIYERYLNDSENAIISLINGAYWIEAISMIHKFDRFDFFETNLIPSLKTNQLDLMKSIEQYEIKFLENKERLEQVRIDKAKQREKELENEYEDDQRLINDDMSVSEISHTTFDNESNAGSVRSSASTVNTQFSKSSKRRKQKKSMISLKKGSVFEDLALIQELSDTITYACNLKDGIASLSKALLLFNMNDICIQIQNSYDKLMDLIEKNLNQIWDYDLTENAQNSFISTTTKFHSDFSKLDAKYRYPPQILSKRLWKLHFYE